MNQVQNNINNTSEDTTNNTTKHTTVTSNTEGVTAGSAAITSEAATPIATSPTATRVLVVIDMQNDFIDGALGTPEAQAIVPNVVAKIKSYPAQNVYATLDTHPTSYLTTQEGKNLPIEHCIKGTVGWELAPQIASLINPSHIFEKPTFGSTQLASAMKALAEAAPTTTPLEIELVGLCTDICVVSNALLLKATLPETLIKVDPTCCAGVTPTLHEAALTTLRSCQIQVEAQEKIQVEAQD